MPDLEECLQNRLGAPAVRVFTSLAGLLVLCMAASGCHHRAVQAPAPPPPPATAIEQPAPAPEATPEQPRHARWRETGLASWYGAPYRNARSADGEIYDERGMTAAQRTLPMGTIVRVTDLATHRSAIVTITDRGPFVPGRIIDLSRAAAQKIGLLHAGVARVRVEVLRWPAYRPGHWCVQIGAMHSARTAHHLHRSLAREYPEASVIDFRGQTGYWVRIKPASHTKAAAESVIAHLRVPEGEAYLVRLN
jgi:rare lipoprotein A